MSAYQNIVNDVFREDGFNPAPLIKAFLALVFLAATLIGTYYLGRQSAAARLETEAANNQTQYYRGLYDTCIAVNENVYHRSGESSQVECLGVVEAAIHNNWYALDSAGWRWPLDK